MRRLNRWTLAAFALAVCAAAVGIVLAACVGWHRCCAPQPVVYVTQAAVVVTRVLPTQTPADTATPRTVVVYVPTVVEVEVTRVTVRVVEVTPTAGVVVPKTGRP